MRAIFWYLLLACAWPAHAPAAEAYRKPPQVIQEVLDAPRTPAVTFSPTRNYALLATSITYLPISDVARPVLRLAGYRINPENNGPHAQPYYVRFTLKKIADGSEMPVALPADARASAPQWSPDGKRFAFTNITPSSVELWVVEASSGKAGRIEGAALNTALGVLLSWMPDSRGLRIALVPAHRGMPPQEAAPAGPNVQESSGKSARVRTYEDLLRSAHDEDLFDYYAASQLALVDVPSGRITPTGPPGIYHNVQRSPDGKYLFIERLHRPYSYLYPARNFARDLELWDASGKLVKKIASLGLTEPSADDSTPGPRGHRWQASEPATLVWMESLGRGNEEDGKARYRDKVMLWRAPFTGEASELVRTEHRISAVQWAESGAALISEFDIARRWTRLLIADPRDPGKYRVVSSRSSRDSYKDPGTPVLRMLPNGALAVQQHEEYIYFSGRGASPAGDRPFLDRLSLATLKPERLFQSDANRYESVAALLAQDASRFVTERQSLTEPENYYIRTTGRTGAMPLTQFQDPAPILRKIRKQRVTYKRPDGVQLSFTLYLPPDYKEGTRLPTVMWAYPLEFSDADTAGQISGSTERFTTFYGPSHLFLTLAGYAVLDGATMPVVGDPKTANDTYVEQIVASAKAAIDKAAEMGVTDPERVGVGGHSYGAFMTANLLSHSRLFRAGVARSGAYNRTLTPFGFQNERRTLWEAPDTYLKMSPFLHANGIKDPLLLIHGEADDNQGTFPIQSERMYPAIRGNGGTVRLVMLPAEAHSYRARESVEHVLWEMIHWFDEYVKDAPPRAK